MDYDVDKWDMEDIDDKPLNKKNKRDVEMAREYCDEHEQYYGSQTCEPIWKRGGDLSIYEIIVHPNKKSKLDFVKKRNEKKTKKKKTKKTKSKKA